MPTYEYACTQCGHRFEEFQSIQAAPIRECPACAGRVERLINGGAGLIFKGSGFYLTDYKKSSAKSDDNGGSTKSEPKAETTSAKSTDKTSSAEAKS
jgi:putative FmdB family regulatory protein